MLFYDKLNGIKVIAKFYLSLDHPSYRVEISYVDKLVARNSADFNLHVTLPVCLKDLNTTFLNLSYTVS